MDGKVIVSREKWLEARTKLLVKEKELTKARDELAEARRALPWVKVEKEYVFDGPEGPVTLAGLFAGRSQLFVKHFMMGPGATTQCVGCSLEVDHVDGILVHLENHDVSYAAVARAPIEEIEAVRTRMGWRFTWVSSYHNDFNYDFNVSFTDDQLAARRGFYNFAETDPMLADLSGDSVFYRDTDGQSITPTPPSRAAASNSWASTTTSTSPRTDAPNTGHTTAYPIGSALTTATATPESWNRAADTTHPAAPAPFTRPAGDQVHSPKTALT